MNTDNDDTMISGVNNINEYDGPQRTQRAQISWLFISSFAGSRLAPNESFYNEGTKDTKKIDGGESTAHRQQVSALGIALYFLDKDIEHLEQPEPQPKILTTESVGQPLAATKILTTDDTDNTDVWQSGFADTHQQKNGSAFFCRVSFSVIYFLFYPFYPFYPWAKI